MKIKTTERGWAGHFICANKCLFRRNTLIQFGEIRLVVSTVGNYLIRGDKLPIGYNRYHETMVFVAKLVDGKYWDADIGSEMPFNSNWSLDKDANDNQINDMHEAVVAELSGLLEKGIIK